MINGNRKAVNLSVATVTNVPKIAALIQQLGWTSVQVSEIVNGLASASIPAFEFCAYLDALIAAPEGMNDQTIASCPGAPATLITNYLKSHQLVAT
jgi:hypothetical protein